MSVNRGGPIAVQFDMQNVSYVVCSKSRLQKSANDSLISFERQTYPMKIDPNNKETETRKARDQLGVGKAKHTLLLKQVFWKL